MEKPRKGIWLKAMKRFVLTTVFLVLCIIPVRPEGFRNIASLTFSYYFNETYRFDTLDVLLIRIIPILSVKIEANRIDATDWYTHVFSLGPVINFTETFYMDAVYGLGIDSQGQFSHKFDANLTQETETLEITFGARGLFFPSSGYHYYLPSMSGAIYPVDQLRLFCKIFFSWDSEDVITGSVWGEAAYSFTSLFMAHAGFTISYTDGFGYSVIGGCKFTFSEAFTLKYFIQYLGDIIEYLDTPVERNGIANGIIADIRF
ncbi:MAG: hypothetical protein JXB88_11250 [Spirochaetales bacterium]|nr:hypothetical protein [Spirochaetales bacterium]